ncbi:hypothetical protein SLE2022_112520 [Rubroshorea leprosula]
MVDGNKNWFACSSSMKTLWCIVIIVPMILLSFFASDLVPKSSSWVSNFSMSDLSPSSPSLNTSEILHAQVEGGGGQPVDHDLRYHRVVAVDVHGVVEAPLAEVAMSPAAGPPLAVQNVRIGMVICSLLLEFDFCYHGSYMDKIVTFSILVF